MATEDINYVTRPKTKPDVTTKGKMNQWNNGYAEFVPAGSKPSNRTLLKQLGNSSFYKTEGTKDSSYSLHLNVDGKSEDPVGEMLDQFLLLTADERKKTPKLPEGSEGRMLLSNDNLRIWLDREKHKVSILAELECDSNIERMLLQSESQMNVTIARFRNDIINNK